MRNLAAIFKDNPHLVALNRGLLLTEVPEAVAILDAPPIDAPPAGHKPVGWASEEEFAKAVDNKRRELSVLMPELELMHHVPNENSHRKAGVVAGMPDWNLPVARGKWAGMWIELKAGKGKLRASQLNRLAQLRAEGHYCVVVWDSVEQVFSYIRAYLALGAREDRGSK